MSLETKVGGFVLTGLLCIATAIFLLGDYTFERRYTIYVTFADVANLSKDAPVKLAGVEVGKVRELVLEDNLAKVVAAIRHDVEIYKNAEFSIGSTGIIGSKFLQIDQGNVTAGKIHPGAIVRGVDPVSIEKSLTKTMDKLQTLLEDLTKEGPRGSLSTNLRETVANVREMTANLNDLIETTKPQLERAMSRADDITEKLDSLLAKSNTMMASLTTSSGTVGALLHDPEIKSDVKQTIASAKEAAATAKDVLGRITQFRVDWNYDWRYEHLVRTSRVDIGLRISPRENRYYYVGGSNLGNISDDPRQTRHVDYAQVNRVDALLGFIKGPFDLGAGVIRSAGGARVTYVPDRYDKGWKGRIALEAQAYDFGRNRVVNARRFDQPHYDVGARVKVQKHVHIGGRAEDLATVPRYQSWVKIMFEDQDIAYLFGMASFGAAGSKGRSKK